MLIFCELQSSSKVIAKYRVSEIAELVDQDILWRPALKGTEMNFKLLFSK
jgi:hypothetical protein